MSKVILIVTDSMGVGELPDAADYGDRGADTFGHILERWLVRILWELSEKWRKSPREKIL